VFGLLEIDNKAVVSSVIDCLRQSFSFLRHIYLSGKDKITGHKKNMSI